MAWARIAVTLCLLFAGWCAVDKARSSALLQIPWSLGVLNISNMSGVSSSIQMLSRSNSSSTDNGVRFSDLGNTSLEISTKSLMMKTNAYSQDSSSASRGNTLAERRACAKSLCECVWGAAVDFLKVLHFHKTDCTAVRQIARFWDLGYAGTWLVLLTPFLLSIVFAKWYYGGAKRKKAVSVTESPRRTRGQRGTTTRRRSRSPPGRRVERRTSLSISKLVRGRHHAPRCDDDCGLRKNGIFSLRHCWKTAGLKAMLQPEAAPERPQPLEIGSRERLLRPW
ncbi:uncharacterized protein LOC144100520 isoform X2 [Amblyomma americanum]